MHNEHTPLTVLGAGSNTGVLVCRYFYLYTISKLMNKGLIVKIVLPQVNPLSYRLQADQSITTHLLTIVGICRYHHGEIHTFASTPRNAKIHHAIASLLKI